MAPAPGTERLNPACASNRSSLAIPSLPEKSRGSVGNLYGDPVKVMVDPAAKGEITLAGDKVVQKTPFRETEIVPGDHGSMMSPALRSRLDSEMAASFLAHKIAPGSP
ncbi:MAG: hypothetical protein JWL77_6329 [Chthonomonadaceae bacterium]|nr:hypothetical protein [Chthonomonadaceae bacterium]